MAEYVDTHCHIHAVKDTDADNTSKKWRDAGEVDPVKIKDDANAVGVSRLICVGTSSEDSIDAVNFADQNDGAWAAVGIHPHEAEHFDEKQLKQVVDLLESDKTKSSKTIVAIGEVGLDYFYENSPKSKQIIMLEQFLDLAIRYDLPLIFHVREAFDDFWPIFDNFHGARGVLHSFTANSQIMDQALDRGLYIGLNGIITFTREQYQLDMAKAVPLDSLMLETDAPYLTPKPLRGKICKPEHVVLTAKFLSGLREEELEVLASATTSNACKIFSLD